MRIAISGTIGSGKSTVCLYLREKGYDVFDCDKVNAKLLEKGEEGYRRVKEAFPECFDEDGLNKKKLSSVVFSDLRKKKALEQIMHPLILKAMFDRKDDPLFAEVPLLFEAGWDVYFDHNLLVVTDEEKLILNKQMPTEEKIKRADKIIYNNGSMEDLYRLVDDWLEEILC